MTLYRRTVVNGKATFDLMTADEVERQERVELRIVLRHVLLQRARGRTELAAKTLGRLADLGVQPTALDYVACVLSWPEHFIRKKMRQAAFRTVTPADSITEAEFASLSDSAARRVEVACLAGAPT